jgi:hypothetical protein
VSSSTFFDAIRIPAPVFGASRVRRSRSVLALRNGLPNFPIRASRAGVTSTRSRNGSPACRRFEGGRVGFEFATNCVGGPSRARDAGVDPLRCQSDASPATGRFVSVSRRPSFEADLVGAHPGLGPDGHKDVVIDVVFDGPVIAFSIESATASTEASTGWGRLETEPSVRPEGRKHSATLIVFDKGAPLNTASNPFALGSGRHGLQLRVSGYYVNPQTPWRIFALGPDCSLFEGPSIK